MRQRQVEEIEVQIRAWHRSSEASKRVEKVPGIGPLTAKCLGRYGERRQELRRRSSARGVARFGSATAFQRRQADFARHEQARRRVPENAAELRCPIVNLLSNAESRLGDLVGQAHKTAQQEHGRGSAGQQDCQDRVGAARARPRIPIRLPKGFSAGVVKASVDRLIEDHTTGCSGDHAAMARRVRPWLAQRAPDEAVRVRVSDRGADQQNPSVTASSSRAESPNVRVQSFSSRCHEMRPWQTEGVHVRPAVATVRALPVSSVQLRASRRF